MKSKPIYIWRIILFLSAAWTCFMLIIIAYQVNNIKSDTLQNGLITARIALAKDMVYRRWISMVGGVYVSTSEKITPNPYLDISERELEISNGGQLTLINPAYMSRMVHELEREEKGVLGHFTSLNPINPGNVADEAERNALRTFTSEDDVYSSVEEMDGIEYLRYMKPFVVIRSCLKCHGHEGYALGDIQGGLSVSVPMAPLRALEWSSVKQSLLIHGSLWLIGLAGLWWGGRRAIGQQLAQQHAEKEKEKLQIKLLQAQKLESVGQLAAGIAHEINTPIQFIGTNLDFMEQTERDLSDCMSRIQEIAENGPEEVTDAINKAIEESDCEYLFEELPLAISQSRDGIKRVAAIVQAMKEFSHPATREMEPQNLNKIINTTITVAGNEWKYVADMELDLDPHLPQIPLLADEMGQVLLNMLLNAAHAIGEKTGANPEGDKGTISITTRKTGDTVELRIQDTGTGIPEEARPYIFDPFYSTKEVGSGIGQGLAISHDVIVGKHGGAIDFKTETGRGTEFIIQLPLRNGEIL